MLPIVKTLVLFLILLSINGCAPKTVYVNVPQKCYVPVTQEPDIDYSDTNTTLDKVKQLAKNYFKMKEYAETLKNNSTVCQ